MRLDEDFLEEMAAIERTRAQIVRFTRKGWDGSGVWSSSDKATRPVYEDTKPYEKLPAWLRDKSFIDLTLSDVLLYVLAADRADPALDKMIWYKAIFDPALEKGEGMSMIGTRRLAYSHSLDAATRLYRTVPLMIPSDALDICAEAIEQRLTTPEEP